MRLRLIIAYDGRPYAGWQSQASSDAVQDFLEQAFQKVTGERVVVHGAGRTDAGVHALGQCAHADVAGAMSPPEWRRALNANLPPTIRVMSSRRATPHFHARFAAKAKIYRYVIRHGPVLPPLEFGRAWHGPSALNIDLLRQAMAVLIGRHNFAAFCANRGKLAEDATRTLRRIALSQRHGLITLTFEGEGFLYKMVRMLTGAIVRVGQEREPLEGLQARLETGSPKWNHVAPSDGLYLVRVLY
ncbi:MAG TPA: tRNA pseudouridine(38-40) synthase TruA [Terrimicrobiaceae bacterium]|nr:tRNA pseudouridine(38-40) synthase TruA [Terrimicrobiaceae bacterium]